MGLERLANRGVLSPLRRDAGTLPAVALPVMAIAVSELLVYIREVELAIGGHLSVLLICTAGPLFLESETHTFRAFALVPIFRLVNLGMPLFFSETLYSLLLIYGSVLPAVILIGVNIPSISPFQIGRIPRIVSIAPIVVLLSLLLAQIEYLIINPDPFIQSWTTSQVLLLAVIMIGFISLVEELLFRGILQRTLQSRLGPKSGLVLASIVFGLMHSGNASPAEMGFAAGVGIVFGVVYDWTDSLILVILFHGLLNIFLFGMIPLLGGFLFLS